VHHGDEVDTFLVEEWLESVPSTPVLDGASVAIVRDLVRQRAGEIGMPADRAARLVNVASELAQNQLAHARNGEIAVVPIQRGAVRGLEVRAADSGRGLVDPARAFRGGASTAGTLGQGLAAVAELADELDVDTRRGEGSFLCARVFAARVTRGREVGVIGRPIESEDFNGDDALVRRVGDALVAIVIDGLGHGDEAREAALVAKRMARSVIEERPEEILAACHAAAAGTRGVAMTVARVEPTGVVRLAGVGNVAAYIVGPKTLRRFTGSAAVLGAPGPLRRVATEEIAVTPYDAIILHTDGISSRTIAEDDRDLVAQLPIVIAARLLERYGTDNDDALVLALR
jgi:anti-sigma regulatory factor (Ser/Thr protein kinase)